MSFKNIIFLRTYNNNLCPVTKGLYERYSNNEEVAVKYVLELMELIDKEMIL